MAAEISRLQSPGAIQAALDEYSRLGRTAFLTRYGFRKSRDFLVRDGKTGQLCDSKAIVGAAFGYQFPEEGPLKPSDFSGGEATVVSKLQRLGFEVVRIGEDWTSDEVRATVASYFEMLWMEAAQQRYTKTEFNAQLRQKLRGRSKSSVELKYQNISAVLHDLELPFVRGYKPRSNVQLLLRQAVQQFVLDRPGVVSQVVDAMEEVKTPGEQSFHALVVEPPNLEELVQVAKDRPRIRLPRKVNWAQRDDANRNLGRPANNGSSALSSGDSQALDTRNYFNSWIGSLIASVTVPGTTSSRMSGPASTALSRSRLPTVVMPPHSSSAATNWNLPRRWKRRFISIECSSSARRPSSTSSRETWQTRFIWSRLTIAHLSGGWLADRH